MSPKLGCILPCFRSWPNTRDAAKRSQVIFTTHSPEFLNAFGEEAPTTTVVECSDGQTTLHVISGDELSYWLKQYTLGEMFRSRELEAMK